MIFFRRRKVGEDQEQSCNKKCDHEWVEVEPHPIEMKHYRRYCKLCGKLIVDVRKFVCKKCGRRDLRYKFLEEEHGVLSVKAYKPSGYPPDYFYIRLCNKCYQSFKKFISDLKARLEEHYKIVDFEPVEYETHFIRNIDLLYDLLRELVYYGSPFKEDYGVKGHMEIYGLGAYIVLKHLGKTLKIIIPYDVIVSYMKTKTNKGESRNDLREEKP